MTADNHNGNRLDRIEQLIERIGLQQEIGTRTMDLLAQRVDSNAKSIEALTASIAADRADIAATRATVDGLVQTLTELSIRSEARLNRLEDAVVGIEQILENLTRRDRDSDGDQL